MRRWLVPAAVALLVLGGPAAAQCEVADPERLLADSQASFVGTLVGGDADRASFVVTEVVTGPLELGPLEVAVTGEPYPETADEMGYFLGRRGGDWTGSGCEVTDAETLRALGPDGGDLTNPDSHPEEPPYSLFLIGVGVVVAGVWIARLATKD